MLCYAISLWLQWHWETGAFQLHYNLMQPPSHVQPIRLKHRDVVCDCSSSSSKSVFEDGLRERHMTTITIRRKLLHQNALLLPKFFHFCMQHFPFLTLALLINSFTSLWTQTACYFLEKQASISCLHVEAFLHRLGFPCLLSTAFPVCLITSPSHWVSGAPGQCLLYLSASLIFECVRFHKAPISPGLDESNTQEKLSYK